MSGFKRLIHEVHRRSLWQVLAIYLAVSWFVLQVVEVLTGAYGLPPWFPGLAAALLFIGLPFTLATAFVQEGGPSKATFDPTQLPDLDDHELEPAATAGEPGVGLKRLFSWRNVLVIGVACFAVWGVVSAVWLFVGFPGLVVKAEAADLLEERDEVVVAGFEGETEQSTLGLAVREAVVTDLAGSDYVDVVDRAELNGVLQRMRLPDTTTVTESVAIDAALREGYPVVISGSVTRLGSGYQLSARIVEAASGEAIVRVRETAATDDDVIATVERLSRLIRRHLGESLGDLRRSEPLPQVTTGSLEALELYARGSHYGRTARQDEAIPLLEQAVRLDTAFATAYRALSIFYGNLGYAAEAQRYVDRAYAHSDRLERRERYLVGALYHAWRFRFDSAAYYYELEIERDPESYVAINNLGDIYETLGRYEDAEPLYRRAVELRPDLPVPYVNLASISRTLGNHAAADSALDFLNANYPNGSGALMARVANPMYAGDFAAAEAAAGALAADPRPYLSVWGHSYLSSLAALRGDTEGTLAYADTAVELGVTAGARVAAYLALIDLEFAMLAAGAPERALPLLEKIREVALDEQEYLPSNLGLGALASGYALAGDLSRAREYLVRLDAIAGSGAVASIGTEVQVRGIIALQEGRVDDAIEDLNRGRARAVGLLRREAGLLLADAYAAAAQAERAAALYDSLTSSYRLNFTNIGMYGPARPTAHERAARAYLAVGDTTRAVAHLTEFARLWEDADPELSPRVESALRLLAQLSRDR
ncbi:MAG: tetratricopeptide repeat protein [Gemmatimonadales bacterium]|jgi:tetratricopeptide (TPR) repeat protein